MSRIAKYPVVIPDKVEVTVGSAELTVKGPLGTMKQAFGSQVTVLVRGKGLLPRMEPFAGCQFVVVSL